MKYLILLILISIINNSYINPVIDIDAPDPGILYYKNSYWVVTTGGNSQGIFVIRQSLDLVKWMEVGTVFTHSSKPSWAIGDYWAPELHIINGKINVYFSARHSNGRLTVGGGVSTIDSPAGPYRAFENPIVEDESGAIDVSVIQDHNTKVNYLIWKIDGNAFGRKTPIYAARLNENGSAIEGDRTFLIQNDMTWEDGLVEGPWIHYHEGYYYLFYSGQGYSSPLYAVGVARSQNLLGPYTKAAGPIMSQIGNNANGHHFSGPGHNSIVTVPNTNVDIMVYHSWLSGRVGQSPGRNVLIDRIWWSDGWPVVGVCGTPSYQRLPNPTSEEFAKMPMDVRLIKNTVITLGSYQWSDHCWNSHNFTIDGNCNEDDNKMVVREGLAGPGTFSLESFTKPGYFWRHYDYFYRLDQNDQSEVFKLDCSFIANAGLEDAHLLSLRPSNFPDSVVRHYDGKIRFSKWDQNDPFGKDATWRVNTVLNNEYMH